MDKKLKALMEELGNAINNAMSDSVRIAAAIGEIRLAGYDVFIVLEATIGLNKREEAGAAGPFGPITSGPRDHNAPQCEVKWTSQDEKFLRRIKIAPEDPS